MELKKTTYYIPHHYKHGAIHYLIHEVRMQKEWEVGNLRSTRGVIKTKIPSVVGNMSRSHLGGGGKATWVD